MLEGTQRIPVEARRPANEDEQTPLSVRGRVGQSDRCAWRSGPPEQLPVRGEHLLLVELAERERRHYRAGTGRELVQRGTDARVREGTGHAQDWPLYAGRVARQS